MALIRDIEVEGVTTFDATQKTSYRYILKLKSDKLSIWMEDRTSKKQWYKGEMAKDDYVTSANVILDASAMDYLRCFQDSLDSKLEESSDVQRTLEILEGGALQLAFAVKIRILRSTRVAKYAFILDPVSVERIDVLESKLRDQQEELKRLRGDFQARRAHIELKSSTKVKATSNLLWNFIESDNFAVNKETGEVLIRRPGIYSITVVVNATTSDSNSSAQMMKNETCVQLAYFSSGGYGDYCHSVTLCISTALEVNDLVAVKCECNIEQAFLSIVHLGF